MRAVPSLATQSATMSGGMVATLTCDACSDALICASSVFSPGTSAADGVGRLLLDAQQVTMQFGGLKAVDKVDLQVHAGEIVGLIGPNGAGKTTFFNCLTGLYVPTEGTVKYQGNVLPPKPHLVTKALESDAAHTLARDIDHPALLHGPPGPGHAGGNVQGHRQHDERLPLLRWAVGHDQPAFGDQPVHEPHRWR